MCNCQHTINSKLKLNELSSCDSLVVCITGITDGALLEGVNIKNNLGHPREESQIKQL